MSKGIERIETLPSLPKRPEDSHKGLFGTVLVVAGGRGMAGAAALCAVRQPFDRVPAWSASYRRPRSNRPSRPSSRHT